MSSFEQPCLNSDEMAVALQVDGVAHVRDLAVVEIPDDDMSAAVVEARRGMPVADPKYDEVKIYGVVSPRELQSETGPQFDATSRLLGLVIGKHSVVARAKFFGDREKNPAPDDAERVLSRAAGAISRSRNLAIHIAPIALKY